MRALVPALNNEPAWLLKRQITRRRSRIKKQKPMIHSLFVSLFSRKRSNFCRNAIHRRIVCGFHFALFISFLQPHARFRFLRHVSSSAAIKTNRSKICPPGSAHLEMFIKAAAFRCVDPARAKRKRKLPPFIPESDLSRDSNRRHYCGDAF